MKVQNIKDIDKFFQVIDSCAGKVELVTGEGDRLNLKSKLSQYLWLIFFQMVPSLSWKFSLMSRKILPN